MLTGLHISRAVLRRGRSQGMLFPWQLPFILACQVGHPELSGDELLPPLYGTLFSFEMPSSTYIHACTHMPAFFPSTFTQERRGCGSQWQLSGMVAPSQPLTVSVTWGRNIGRGRMRGVWGEAAIVIVPSDQRSPVVLSVFKDVVPWCQFLTATLTNYDKPSGSKQHKCIILQF